MILRALRKNPLVDSELRHMSQCGEVFAAQARVVQEGTHLFRGGLHEFSYGVPCKGGKL